MNQHSKVVWCVDSPGWGGSEINLLRVWELADRRQDIVVLNITAAPQLLATSAEREFCIFRQRSPNAASHLIIGLIKALCLVVRFWRTKFLVWAHHSDSNRWLQFVLAATRRNFIVIEQLVPASELDFARSRLSIPLKRFVAKHARYMVLNAHTQEQHYRRMFNVPSANIKVIPNSRPISATRRRVDALRQDITILKNQLGLPTSRIIACVGRLCAQKDQSTLIKALTLMNSKDNVPANLVFVGEGEDAYILKNLADQLIPGKAFFAGHQADPLPWLAASDIFVLPSLSEGMPGALIEAMAAGIPCVATDIPGNRELVQHKQTGLLFPPENAELLAAAISTLLDDPTAFYLLAEAGYAHVLKYYDEATEALLWKMLFVQTYA